MWIDQYTFSINGLVLEIFENFLIFSYEISDHWFGFSTLNFSLIANFHIPRVCDFDFMILINLRIYTGFDCENRSGV